MISLEYIRYFLEACDRGSIQAASKKLFLSSQGLGAGILRLENSLGMKLLIRSKSGVTPTKFGKEFYLYASKIAEDMKALEDFCEEYRKSKKVTIFVGVVGESKFAAHTMICAEFFNKENPDTPVDVSPITFANSGELITAIESGDVDAGWIFHVDELPGFVYRYVDDYSPLVLICNKNQPLARKESVTSQDLKSLRFILAGKSDTITDVINVLFQPNSITDNVAMYTTENSLIGKIIDANIASILVREYYSPTITKYCEESAVIPISPELRIANSLIYSKSLPAKSIKLMFFDFLVQYMRSNIYNRD